jgi:hypothetical protein
MLTTTLYRLCSSLLAIERDNTVWVLLSDMPFVGKMPLEMMVSVENGYRCDSTIQTAFKMTTMSVPISRGVEDIDGWCWECDGKSQVLQVYDFLMANSGIGCVCSHDLKKIICRKEMTMVEKMIKIPTQSLAHDDVDCFVAISRSPWQRLLFGGRGVVNLRDCVRGVSIVV